MGQSGGRGTKNQRSSQASGVPVPGVRVGLAVLDGVGVRVTVGRSVGVGVSLGVGVRVRVARGVSVGGSTTSSGVSLGDGLAVGGSVGTGVGVVGVGVALGTCAPFVPGASVASKTSCGGCGVGVAAHALTNSISTRIIL